MFSTSSDVRGIERGRDDVGSPCILLYDFSLNFLPML